MTNSKQPVKRVTVSDIGESEYLSWREHPVTHLFGRLVDTLIRKYETETLKRWVGQSLSNDHDREMCGRVRMLLDMRPGELPFVAFVNELGSDHPEIEEEENQHADE